MARLVLAPLARSDLADIGQYIARDSIDAAIAFLDLLDARMRQLAESPAAYRVAEGYDPPLRIYPYRGYLIAYRIIDGGIEVARVIHGSRDIKRLLGGGTGGL